MPFIIYYHLEWYDSNEVVEASGILVVGLCAIYT